MKLGALTHRPPSSTWLTPAAAIRPESNQRNREFQGVASYPLLCFADELSARLVYQKRMGLPCAQQDVSRLEAMQREIAVREQDRDGWAAVQREWIRWNKVATLFPDEGPLRRELYPKHMEVLRETKFHRRVLATGGNKSGKTVLGGSATTYHATGRYPHWWEGQTFSHPTLCWVANKTAKETRDVNELTLLGPPGIDADQGTGLIPKHLILETTPKHGVVNAFEFIYVRHVSGGTSVIQTKSFDAGRTAFQGAPEVHFIWHDEECPKAVAEESVMRTMTCDGRVLFTYTPIFGLTELTVELFEEAGLDIGNLAAGAKLEDEEDLVPA